MRMQFFFVAVFLVASSAPLRGQSPSGEAVIRAPAGTSEIVITTTSRLAGAIHSLTWGGREFIDSFDHGRQLQSAVNLDAGSPIADETFNPTEAGSRDDGAGEKSSSRLLHLRTGPGVLETVNQMAFWLAPGEKSEENLAKNETILSNHVLTKRVRIGYKNLPQAIDYQVVFAVPTGERHTQATFEALTGYMPPDFERFWQFDSERGSLEPLSDGPGEIQRPVVLATASGSHAMGVYAPPQAALAMTGPTYGRFRFQAEKVVKWNCVFRVRDSGGIAPGGYPFRTFVLVGDLETVRDALRALNREFAAAE